HSGANHEVPRSPLAAIAPPAVPPTLCDRHRRRWLLGNVAGGIAAKKATINARPVNVIRATSSNVYPEVVGFGTVTAKRVWTATAQVGGQVVAAHPRLRSGRIVQAGEVLLQIDRRDYELRVGQRSAELAQAKSQVEQIKLAMQSDQASLKIQQELLDVREEDLSRLRQLRQRSAASQTELDAARSSLLQQQQAVQTLLNSLRTAPAKIASAEAALRLAESKVAEAERDLERTTIAAPFHGVLSGVSTEKEQYVAPNQSLFSVMDIAAVEIEAHFSIAQLRRVNARDTDIDERDDARSMAVPLDAGNSMAQIDVSKESQPDWMTGQLSAVVTLQSGDVSMDFTATPI
ncbi:MAG: HlyD family efflux transporter periplasmic adaptor subunit, partial [Planctomycetota bacterium]